MTLIWFAMPKTSASLHISILVRKNSNKNSGATSGQELLCCGANIGIDHTS
jgi:hypothetical protein